MIERLPADRIFDVAPGDEWEGTDAFVRGRATPLVIDGDTVGFATLAHSSRLGIVQADLAEVAAQTSRNLRHARGENWEATQQAGQPLAPPSS